MNELRRHGLRTVRLIWLGVLALLALVLVLGTPTCMHACTNPERARSTLEGAGYKNIHLTGWDIGCDEHDDTCDGFEATGPSGQDVTGVVGCGYTGCSKACTVRLK